MPKTKAERSDSDLAFDQAVGRRIRQLRLQAGLSQAQLGGAAGTSFQQVQKYESGANRVAASRLAAIARVLGVPISALLGEDGWEPPSVTPDALSLARLFERCSPSAQRCLLDIARTLARDRV